MTQQLSLFPESTTEQPSEDTARARWDQRLDSFENWLRSLNKAKRTIRGYTTDIRQLLDFLEGEGRLEDVIDTDDLIDFLADLQKEGARSRTLDRKRAAFKAFFGYLMRFKRIDDDPSRRLGVPIADYELPLTLTESEVEGLLEAARDHPRDLAILRIFTDCGLRVSELCGLKLEDIDLKESLLYVKGRYVPLPTDAKAALEAWLDQTEGDRVFPIKPRAVRLMVKKYAAAAGIRKAVRPSILRHTFAVLALVRGEDYETVKLTLGHEIDDVMQQYVQRAHQLRTLRQLPHEQA
jgi:integrase/recombinase XerD